MESINRSSNREIAAVFFNMATLLKADPEANRYRVAAYERAGQAMMGLRREAREILAEKPIVFFRRQQHIGKRLQAKIGELVTSGSLAQFEEMLEEAPAPVRELVRSVPGIGPTFAARVHTTLGVTNRAELIQAARDGRLRHVRGFGKGRIAQLAGMSLPGEPRQLTLPFEG